MGFGFRAAVLTGAMSLFASASAFGAIAVDFRGGRGGTSAEAMSPSDVAGVVAQANWNDIAGGSGTDIVLIDDAGAPTLAKLTYTSGGTWSAIAGNGVGGDEKMNNGFVFGNATVTVTDVPYAEYDIYVYTLNDAANRVLSTVLTGGEGGPVNGPAFFGSSPNPTAAGFVDGNAATPYTYNLVTSGFLGSPTANGNYVRFTGLRDSTFTFTTSAAGNGYLGGFQIVPTVVPEPGTIGIVAAATAGLLIRRRRTT